MTTRKKIPAAPAPVPVATVCSVCGLGWEAHGADPTTDDCIRLLKAELAKRPVTVPLPVPQPYPVPWHERGPIWVSHGNSDVLQLQPRRIETICSAVAA